MDRFQILGVQVTSTTVKELHSYIDDCIAQQKKKLILHVNIHCLNLSLRHTWLRNLLNSAEVVFCDGAGVILGARIIGHRVPERITYADWMWQLSAFAEERSLTLFFLGARPGVVEQSAAQLQAHFPNLQIVGMHHGYFDKELTSAENQAILQQINDAKPNILVVGFGMPMQEHWLMENWAQIDANIALTGGAVFDYISGDLQRAPRWMTENGFEWMGRLLIEPKRLWRRYIIGNPLFLWHILQQRLGLLQF